MRKINTILIVLAALLIISCSGGTSSGSSVQASQKSGRSHPLIFLTSSVMSALNAKVTANDPDWLELKSRADLLLTYSIPTYSQSAWPNNSIPYAYQGSQWFEAATVLGLAYKVTGNTAYAAKLKTLIDVINAAGTPPIAVDSGYPSRNIAVAMALMYDWLYNYLDAPTKTAMITTMNGWYDWYTANGYKRDDPTGTSNYFAGHLYGFGAIGLATYGDNPRASEITAYVRNKWDTRVVPAFTSGAFAGGYAIEAYSYGGPNFEMLLQYAQAVKTATGEDLVSVVGNKIANSLLYNLRPNRWQSTTEGDNPNSYIGVMPSGTALILSNILPGTIGDQMAYYLNDFANTPDKTATDYVQNATPFLRCLFKIPARTQTNYKLTAPTYFRSPGDEHIITRTDWSDNAVWTSFNGGSTHYADHQQAAAGHIEVVRGFDNLLVNPAEWRGTAGFTGNPQNNYLQSVGSNTLYTYDGGAYQRLDFWYEGGQNWFGTNTVLKFESTSNGKLIYMKADLTSAYFADPNGIHSIADRSVIYFHRNFVTTDGGATIVVYDRVQLKNAAYPKKLFWYVHPLSTTSLINNGLLTSDYGSSRLHVKTVFPASPIMNVVNDPPIHNWVNLNAAPNATLYGKRVEVDGGTASRDFNPLTVLLATASGIATPQISGIDVAAMQGALIASSTPQVVMFSKDGSQQNAVTYTAVYSSGITGKHLLVDLEPSTYDIYRDGVKILTSVVTSSQGVLTFSATGGTVFKIIKSI